jgi:hypothetical protein
LSAEHLNHRTELLVQRHPQRFKSFTADNGTEFHDYAALELRIPAKPVTDSGLRRSLIPVEAGRCDAGIELSKMLSGSSTFCFG